MKHLLPILAIALFLGSADANATYCTNGATDYPTCTPKKKIPVKPPAAEPAPTPAAPPAAAPAPTVVVVPGAAPAPVTAQLAAELTPSQVATLRQQAAAEAAGGGGGAGGAGGGATLSDQSIHKGSYAVGLNITPATTPAMAAVTCPTPEITQETQFGTIIGSVGRGSSKTSSADCVVLTVTARMKCRPRTVALAEGALLEKHLPGFKAPVVPTSVQDFAEDCDKPVAAVAPPPVVQAPPPPAPPAPLAPPPVQKVSLSADALFDFDKAVLKPAGKARLDALAATLQGEVGANIVVTGHTDGRGSDAYNRSLSMRRANAVRAHLALAGVDLARMVAIGKGKTEPIADNSTDEGRALNRRVEVQITVVPASAKLASMMNRSGGE